MAPVGPAVSVANANHVAQGSTQQPGVSAASFVAGSAPSNSVGQLLSPRSAAEVRVLQSSASDAQRLNNLPSAMPPLATTGQYFASAALPGNVATNLRSQNAAPTCSATTNQAQTTSNQTQSAVPSGYHSQYTTHAPQIPQMHHYFHTQIPNPMQLSIAYAGGKGARPGWNVLKKFFN